MTLTPKFISVLTKRPVVKNTLLPSIAGINVKTQEIILLLKA
jgi:hypothetical protein